MLHIISNNISLLIAWLWKKGINIIYFLDLCGYIYMFLFCSWKYFLISDTDPLHAVKFLNSPPLLGNLTFLKLKTLFFMRVSIYNPETIATGSTLWFTISPGFIMLFINQGVSDSVIMYITDFVSTLQYFYIVMHRFQPSYLNIWYLNKCKNINASLGLYTRLSWKRHYSEKLFYGNVTGGENRARTQRL